jgi:predicted nucleic acid-binding Zn ribbon protein
MANTDSHALCTICGKALHFEGDTCADENGQAVHKDCYATKLIAGTPKPVDSPAVRPVE